MKSEALQFLESRLAIGHINIPEFVVLHGVLSSVGRLVKLVKRTYSGEIAWRYGSELISKETTDARKHLESFHRLYSHTAAECQIVATSRHGFDPSNSGDRLKAKEIRSEFKNDIERLPGTRELLELISANFDDNIYHPFLESHRRHPTHPIWQLNGELTATYIAIVELYSLVCDAEGWAAQIDKKLAEFRRTCDEHAEGLALRHGNETSLPYPAFPRTRSAAAMSGNTPRKKTSYKTPSHPYGASCSFGAIEEVVTRRTTTSKGNYVIDGVERVNFIRPPVESASQCTGHVVPRVFTESFSELDKSTRKLRISRPQGSPILRTTIAAPVVATDPVSAPLSHTTPLPSIPHAHSPGQLLRRREAFVKRDVESLGRVIDGDIIRCGRPGEGELLGAPNRQAIEQSALRSETLARRLHAPPLQQERKILSLMSSKESDF